MKLGKQPAHYDKRTLNFSAFLDTSILPTIPETFGHTKEIKEWGGLGNFTHGDCVIASGMHMVMNYKKASTGIDVPFTDEGAIKTYHQVNHTQEDRGTNMLTFLKYWHKHGIKDENGELHKCGPYAYINPKKTDHIKVAIYLFGGVKIGINLPDYYEEQFRAGKPWSVKPGPVNFVGGHDVPALAKYNKNFTCITWAKEQEIEPDFIYSFCDECYVIISPDYFNGKKQTPEGYDLAALMAQYKIITA